MNREIRSPGFLVEYPKVKDLSAPLPLQTRRVDDHPVAKFGLEVLWVLGGIVYGVEVIQPKVRKIVQFVNNR